MKHLGIARRMVAEKKTQKNVQLTQYLETLLRSELFLRSQSMLG